MQSFQIKKIFASKACVGGKISENVQITLNSGSIKDISFSDKPFSIPTNETNISSNENIFLSKESETAFILPPLILLPGLVDSHVHVNDPGRNNWETFEGATKAAASGGICTLGDMPLNSIPSTTSRNNLGIKLKAAEKNCWIDVSFIGGVVSGNENDIKDLFFSGVRGFKCFLIHSGVEEFQYVTEKEALNALREMSSWEGKRKPFLMYHAELEDESVPETKSNEGGDKYETYLKTKPPIMENKAIDLVIKLCETSGVRSHIVHLSSASALGSIKSAKEKGIPLTVETCFHYLSIFSENIPDSNPKFKCCPPIREKKNQDLLWEALENGLIDMVVSDHSPCTHDLKFKNNNGNFLEAWGGISSLSLGLPILWTEISERKLENPFEKITKWCSEQPAKLLSLEKKGKIEIGFDADFCIFNPELNWTVEAKDLLFKNKHSPYEGRNLKGRVESTFLRGKLIFDRKSEFLSTVPQGNFLLE